MNIKIMISDIFFVKKPFYYTVFNTLNIPANGHK